MPRRNSISCADGGGATLTQNSTARPLKNVVVQSEYNLLPCGVRRPCRRSDSGGTAAALHTLLDEPPQVVSQRREQRELRRQPALPLLLALKQIAHRDGALAVPALAHLAVRALLLEHGHDVLAVDDLRVMVDAEDAGHRAGGVAGELHQDRKSTRLNSSHVAL